MQLALYRAERPEVFNEIIGQKHIVRILQNQLKSGTVGQAYLFTGTHGTGKTSTARILAKALNCLEPVDGLPCGTCANCEAIREGRFIDVIELDAASNNGVDSLRSIIDLVKYPPTVGRYKVFIIDEVHMLSIAAENAFLKTLEEPPEYAMFILATTDPQKVKATIKSRCMQLNFRRVSEAELATGMNNICAKRGVNITEDALYLIAKMSDGSVRDALSLLEQCMAAGDPQIDRKLVLEYTACAGEDFYLELTKAVIENRIGDALSSIDDIMNEGKDAKQVIKDWLEHYRNLMICRYVKDADKILKLSKENVSRIEDQARAIEPSSIEGAIKTLSEFVNLGRYSDRPRILLETAAVKLMSNDSDNEPTIIKKRTASAPKTDALKQNSVSEQKSTPQKNSIPVHEEKAIEDVSSNELRFEVPKQDADTEEANRKLAMATTNAGDATDMWKRIAEEVGKISRPIGMLANRNSQAISYDNNELVVMIRKAKLPFVQDAADDISRVAKEFFGEMTYVSFKIGEPKEAIVNGDDVEEMADNVQTLLGCDVDIT